MVPVVYFVLLLFIVSFCDSYDLVVETNYGKVGGVVKKSNKNENYFSFAGIPFAKPPVGDLRFANPEKSVAWDGVLDGSTSSPRCIQRNYLFYVVPPVEGSEDCLYLNVYVPQGYGQHKKNKLPVMVSIPWGGFIAGGGDEGFFDPSYLMDYDVILVSINYRLGIFGFLSTLDDAAPGNFGLKDQVLALQWVQENIECFGGIKENVTIIGQSAGAGSANLHMISPASKGLFSKAISQSGNAMALWATPFNEVQKTVISTQAQLVNCTDAIGNSTKLIQCLRKVSAQDLALSLDALKSFYQYPLTPYTLVVENYTENNPNPFLTKTPLEYVEAGEFRKVPWLTGTVKNEGLVIVSGLLGTEQERIALNASFESIITGLLYLSMITNNTAGLYKNISQQYLGNKNFISDDEWQQGFIDLWSDRFFTYSAFQAVSLQVAKGHDSIYFYSFEYSGEYTFAGVWADGSGPYNPNWEISHCDDLLYQFKLPDIFKNQLTSDTDKELSNTLLSLWVNFATYGNPNPPENLVLKDLNWEPLRVKSANHLFTNDDIKLLNITGNYKTGAHFNVTQGFNKERMSFWEENKIIERS